MSVAFDKHLRRVVELTDAAVAYPRPASAEDVGKLLAAVEAAHQAFVRMMSEIGEADFTALGEEISVAADRILSASREALTAARRHTTS